MLTLLTVSAVSSPVVVIMKLITAVAHARLYASLTFSLIFVRNSIKDCPAS